MAVRTFLINGRHRFEHVKIMLGRTAIATFAGYGDRSTPCISNQCERNTVPVLIRTNTNDGVVHAIRFRGEGALCFVCWNLWRRFKVWFVRVGFVGADRQASSLLFLFLSYSFISSNTMFQTTFVALVFIEINVQSIEIQVPWSFAGAGREQCPSRRWGERRRRRCVLVRLV